MSLKLPQHPESLRK